MLNRMQICSKADEILAEVAKCKFLIRNTYVVFTLGVKMRSVVLDC